MMRLIPIGDYTDRLNREEDGSVYAYRCRGCGCVWKIYQQETHYAGCAVRMRVVEAALLGGDR